MTESVNSCFTNYINHLYYCIVDIFLHTLPFLGHTLFTRLPVPLSQIASQNNQCRHVEQ